MSTFTFYKKQRFNPHHIWALFCMIYIVVLTVLFAAGGWYFMRASARLDAPIEPVFVTNAAKIQEMQQALDTIEKVIEKRTKY